MVQTLDKIGFYVVDKRHFDYYGNVLNELSRQGIPFELIINDQLSDVKATVSASYDQEMMDVAKRTGHPFRSLSAVIGARQRFEVLVTTFTFKFGVRARDASAGDRIVRAGYRAMQKILRSLRSSLLSKSLESWLQEFDLSKLRLPEVIIGKKIVQYPKGMDIHLARFPDPETNAVLYHYLCHGEFDSNLVKTRTDKDFSIIGYPRYDNLADPEIKKALNLRAEFGIPANKPIISWIPTYVPREGNDDYNIDNWAPIVAELCDDFAVIVRPHPKRVEKDKELLHRKLSGFGFHVDLVAERDMSEIYAGSEFMLCDYGGVVFSSVYTDQNLVLLNHPLHDTETRRKEILVVYQIRDRLLNVDFQAASESPGTLKRIVKDDACWIEQKKIRNDIRRQFFGGVNAGEGSALAAKALKTLLDGHDAV